jgi:predicted secreted acid phosphatase
MQNVSSIKKQYCDYVNNGQYELDLKSALTPVYKQINAFIGDATAIVAIDVDDTMISSFPFIHYTNGDIEDIEDYDFGWSPSVIEKSFGITDIRLMPAVTSIKDLIDYCNKNNVRVRVLTGRREKYRSTTADLLLNNGYDGMFESMTMKPTDSNLSDAEFKRETIDKWFANGLKIITMVGDQASDIDNNAFEPVRIPNWGYDLSINY